MQCTKGHRPPRSRASRRRASGVAIGVAFAIALASCAHPTPPFADRAGAPAANSIAEEQYLAIDGSRQYLLMRGRSRARPVVLFVHGGPGGSETALMRAFNAELEDDFVMAYWDQRGAGKSGAVENDPPGSLSVARYLADMDRVVDHLREHLGVDRVVLLGHSWGASLGMLYAQRFPRKVATFIGVGQPSSLDAERHAFDFVLQQAQVRGDQWVVDALGSVGDPPYRFDQTHLRDRMLHRYGGYTHASLSLPYIVWRALLTPEAGLGELLGAFPAIHRALRALESELSVLDLAQQVPAAEVPVTFILGRHDQRTWAPLAEAYLHRLRAPNKHLAWLEHSAHNGPFEEPERFRQHVIDAVARLGSQVPVAGRAD